MTLTSGPALDQRATFTCWAQEKMRFGDTDRLGHVNNAVFVTLSETGRIAYLHDPALPPFPASTSWVIARVELDYRAELLWRDVVDIGTTLISVGRSSVRIGQGMFRGETCVATAHNVMVLMDLTSRRATPLPEALREVLLERSRMD